MKWEMEVISPSSSYPSYSSTNWFDNKARWTPAENKMFENALALNDKDTPDRWLRVAKMIPGKTVEDVMRHYRELEVDVSNIEAGLVPIPGYYNATTSAFTLEWVNNNNGFDGQSYYGKRSSAARFPEQERKKGVPWTEEEHKLFLMGLNKYGKGDWRNISRNFVVTRTPTQVASHAQKYFIRQLSGGKDKRRASIHDITTVNLANSKTTPCPDANKRSPDHSTASTTFVSQSPSSTPPNLQWNQPNTNGGLMVFNAKRGNAAVYDANSYPELKIQEQYLHRISNGINGSYSYMRNQNPNNFQLESVQQHYTGCSES